MEPIHDLGAMRFHRFHAEPEARGDVAGAVAFGDQLQDFALARRQRLQLGARGRTVAQVALRWLMQQDVAAIPRSSNPQRIADNFKVFDFQLSSEDLQKLNGLDDAGARIGPDPKTASF